MGEFDCARIFFFYFGANVVKKPEKGKANNAKTALPPDKILHHAQLTDHKTTFLHAKRLRKRAEKKSFIAKAFSLQQFFLTFARIKPPSRRGSQSCCPTHASPGGGIGRRVGLKHQYRKMCRFEPGPGYTVGGFRRILQLVVFGASMSATGIAPESHARSTRVPAP